MPLFLCSWTMHAQFPSFPDSNAVWLMDVYGQSGFIQQNGYHLRGANHDTLINGESYSSLWQGLEGQAGAFAGGLRKDGQERVYYFHPNSNSEHLLYDFNPIAGETMEVWIGSHDQPAPTPVLMHITSVTSMLNPNGTPYTEIGIINDIALSSGQGSNHVWIEGVGGSGGLLSTWGSDIAPLYSVHLNCMQYNDSVWPAGLPGLCSPMSVTEILNNAVMLSPNPSFGRFTVTFPELLTASCFYGVYDALGKLLVQQPLQPGISTAEIDLSRFGAGMYSIKVSSPAQVWQGRVLLE
jgi:hypothetical protein